MLHSHARMLVFCHSCVLLPGRAFGSEYVLAGLVITALVIHFLHLTSPRSVCHITSASLCCARKFMVLKLAFLDSSARGGVVVLVVVADAKVGNGFIYFLFFFSCFVFRTSLAALRCMSYKLSRTVSDCCAVRCACWVLCEIMYLLSATRHFEFL